MTVLGHRTLLVVAYEYSGADVPAGTGVARVPRTEHAFDVERGVLVAHPRRPLRVAFPEPQRAWPATPPQVPRCAACTLAVTELVQHAIAEVLDSVVRQLTQRRGDDSVLLWLLPATGARLPPAAT